MMLKLASICGVQTVAQYTQYASGYAPPYYDQSMPQVMPQVIHHGAPVYTDFAQPYMGAPVYTELQPGYAPPVYDYSMPQVMPQVMPQAVPEVLPQAKQDVPHPDIVKAEQVSYLQTAAENLDTQKQAE